MTEARTATRPGITAPGEPPGIVAAEFPTDPVLLDQVLRPYRQHCKYLRSAVVRAVPDSTGEYRVRAECAFEIPYSCYIDDTGHFNSVEFNICYNQMIYYTIAKTVQEKLAPPFSSWMMDDFWRRQLSDILITDFRSEFRRQMSGRRFVGYLNITGTAEWEGSDLRPALVVLRTACGYSDDAGGECRGTVTVAITDPPPGELVPAAAASGAPAPAAADVSGVPAGELAARLREMPPALRRDELVRVLVAELREALLMSRDDDLPPDANLFELGLTSLRVSELRLTLAHRLGRGIETAVFFDHPTLHGLASQLAPGAPGGRDSGEPDQAAGDARMSIDVQPDGPPSRRSRVEELIGRFGVGG
ncbi:FcoT family thioesterase [Pseudofrankia asymbiotica]|uniref:(2E)-enoyl-[ACP] glycyltransferase n=1 Tax=Pseudofrankia asymbiotica TaxID=1834516 RepID=A0A1V2IEZ1_9ACTN|nr:FcoT family thioesterase [Pseudofrankia asymbiotica]ONH31469.1 hypothetical protein BL253_09625 [Pseudofrankia asymbiotica]